MDGSLILTVNGGSSSLKCALFDIASDSVAPTLNIDLQNISGGNDGFVVALRKAIEQFREEHELGQLCAIGHRVVHGGNFYDRPTVVDASLLQNLHGLTSLAPLHQPVNLCLIEACEKIFPHVPQVACFDTAFHRHVPNVARRYAIPSKYSENGIHRYGFHGISYEYVWQNLLSSYEHASSQRIVVAHLGAGASACAIRNGESIATTMGFSPADGIPMATRTGSIDPGVMVHLVREYEMSADDLERLIFRESGLLALSGVSGSMRDLRASTDPKAQAAIEYFVYWVVREIGSLIAALGGLDMLVFTGGIGANDTGVREDIANALAWNGIELNVKANTDGAPIISASGSRVQVRIVQANEETMVAQHTLDTIASQKSVQS